MSVPALPGAGSSAGDWISWGIRARASLDPGSASYTSDISRINDYVMGGTNVRAMPWSGVFPQSWLDMGIGGVSSPTGTAPAGTGSNAVAAAAPGTVNAENPVGGFRAFVDGLLSGARDPFGGVRDAQAAARSRYNENTRFSDCSWTQPGCIAQAVWNSRYDAVFLLMGVIVLVLGLFMVTRASQ